MSLRSRVVALTRGGILRDVAKLVSGTVGGRLIALAAMPFVTRLYSPEDFALLAVYLGLVSLIAVIACLRLEVAIPLADSDADATHLLILSLGAMLLVGGIILIFVVFAPKQIANALGQPIIEPYLWLVPLGVVLVASYSAAQYWATRARRFGSIARTRITQAAMGVGTMLGLGWMGITPLGLLLGNMLNKGSGGLRLGLDAWRHDRRQLSAVSWHGIAETLRRHRRYPLLSTPEALANVAGVQVPIILIAAFADAEAGFLLLAMQVMFAPMALLGSSISQVYLSRAREEKHAGRLPEFTLGIMSRLIQIGVGPIILVGILAPFVFPVIFGQHWQRAGEIVAIIAPWTAMQFISSPVSMAMYVTNRQGMMFILTVIGFFLRTFSVLGAIIFYPKYVVAGFSAGSTVYYICVCLWVMRSVSFSRENYVKLANSFVHWSMLLWFCGIAFSALALSLSSSWEGIL